MKQSKFNIDDKIYHKTPESLQGLIIDILYSLKYKEYVYTVVVGFGNEYTCLENELTNEKLLF